MSVSTTIPSRAVGTTAVETSVLGFGTGAIGNRRVARTEIESIALVQEAFAQGIRYFDAAPMYGHGLAERRLGAALHGLPREECVVSTKVGRVLERAALGTFDTGFWVEVPAFKIEYDYSYDGAMRAIEASLNRMLIDSFDIAFIHDCDHYTHGSRQPEVFAEAMSGARKALLKLRDEGVIRAVGMGVNDTDVCMAGADAGGFDVFLLAGQYTLLNQDSLDTFMPRAEREGFSIIPGSVFNSGILATGVTPTAYHDNAPPTPEIASRVNRLADAARRFGVPLAALAFHFALSHPAVSSVLLGMGTMSQLERNRKLVDIRVPRELWAELKHEGLIREDAPLGE